MVVEALVRLCDGEGVASCPLGEGHGIDQNVEVVVPWEGVLSSLGAVVLANLEGEVRVVGGLP